MALPTADVMTAVPPAAPVPKKRRQLRFLGNRKARIGMVLFGFFVLLAIFGPMLAPYDPGERGDQLLVPPNGDHWFGTTHLGQDLFSQMLDGSRSVMLVGLVAGVVATVLGVLIGVTSGYLTGVGSEGLSALSNVFLVIPALPLILIITLSLPDTDDMTIALVIGCTSWAWGARVLRAQTLSLRRRDYVEAARATGESTWRIIGFEILPNLTAVIAASFIGTVIFAVLSEITLAFIGVPGVSEWNWGAILFWAQSQQALAQGAWWWFVPPGLAIALLGTGLALLNFGIDEYVNPRLRSSAGTKVRGVRMRVGFTPVVKGAGDERSLRSEHGHD